MKILDYLQWRYATKKMNGQTVPREKLDYILEAIRLTASSSGLQPYEIFVISNHDLLEKIKPIAYNQSQITDASHLIVFAAWNDYSEERINTVFSRMNVERGLPDSATDAYRSGLLQSRLALTPEENYHHAAKQSYIALGTGLLAAAEQGIDATPMEGFTNADLDTLLELREKGLRSVTLLALGYRDTEKDWLVNLKKVRTPKELFITEIK